MQMPLVFGAQNPPVVDALIDDAIEAALQRGAGDQFLDFPFGKINLAESSLISSTHLQSQSNLQVFYAVDS